MEHTIVDVRTPGEFIGGNVTGSINIPLDEVIERSEEIMGLNSPVIFCCQSGARSGQATAHFKEKGLDCENGGGWAEVNSRVG